LAFPLKSITPKVESTGAPATLFSKGIFKVGGQQISWLLWKSFNLSLLGLLEATLFTGVQATEQRDRVDALLGLVAVIPSNALVVDHLRSIPKVKMDVIWFTTAFLVLQI
jgi:hypothetical protein